MMYKIALPILGFENFSKVDVEKLDEFVAFLKFEDGSKISIIRAACKFHHHKLVNL